MKGKNNMGIQIKETALLRAIDKELANIAKQNYKTESEYWYNEGKRVEALTIFNIVRTISAKVLKEQIDKME